MFEFLLWYFELESQLGFKPEGKVSIRLWRLNYSAWEAVREIRTALGQRGERIE